MLLYGGEVMRIVSRCDGCVSSCYFTCGGKGGGDIFFSYSGFEIVIFRVGGLGNVSGEGHHLGQLLQP